MSNSEPQPRIPVWRCPVCAEKFYSREAIDVHRVAMNHGPKDER